MENCSGSMQLETGTINQFYLAPVVTVPFITESAPITNSGECDEEHSLSLNTSFKLLDVRSCLN